MASSSSQPAAAAASTSGDPQSRYGPSYHAHCGKYTKAQIDVFEEKALWLSPSTELLYAALTLVHCEVIPTIIVEKYIYSRLECSVEN